MTAVLPWSSRRKFSSARVRLADYRVAAWAHWSRSSGVTIGYPPGAPFARLMIPAPTEDGQVGGRHLAPTSDDAEAMAVDHVLAHWRLTRRRRFRLIKTEFLSPIPVWEKAARHGMKRDAYRARVDETLSMLADELGIA